MTLLAKQRLTLLALSVFAMWPLVHRGLVARYDITPWKFMGFAMYCVPQLDPRVDVYAHYGERRTQVDMQGSHMKELRREVLRFATFRPVWGELLAPDRVAEAAASILTRAEKIEVVLTKGYLDRQTWRVAARERVFTYPLSPAPSTPSSDGNLEGPRRGRRAEARTPLERAQRRGRK